jgi:hypothetical protein
MRGAISISLSAADKRNAVLYMAVIRLHVPRGSKFVPENHIGPLKWNGPKERIFLLRH